MFITTYRSVGSPPNYAVPERNEVLENVIREGRELEVGGGRWEMVCVWRGCCTPRRSRRSRADATRPVQRLTETILGSKSSLQSLLKPVPYPDLLSRFGSSPPYAPPPTPPRIPKHVILATRFTLGGVTKFKSRILMNNKTAVVVSKKREVNRPSSWLQRS